MALDRIEENELIARVQNGDVTAFAHLVKCYSEQVLTLVSRIVGSRGDAEDIAQEVFIKVYKGIPKFRGDATFSTWLYTIVKNSCYSYLQKKRPQMISLDEDADVLNSISVLYPEEIPETIETRMDFQNTVMECLKKLPPKYNMVMHLFYYQQFRYTEIAEILQIPLSTVKTHLHRALKALRIEVVKNLENYATKGAE